MKLAIKVPVLIVGLVITAVSLIVAVQTYSTRTLIREEAISKAEETAYRYANDIDAYLEVAMDTARTLAHVFETAMDKEQAIAISRDQANALLQGVLGKNPDFLAVWTCWEPNAFDGMDATFKGTQGHDDTGRFIPYWNRGSGDITQEALVDYDQPGSGDYYLLARDRGQEIIVDQIGRAHV